MHDHGPAVPPDAGSPTWNCPFILADLPCGCQDVHYACGYTDREHDHVDCPGTPLADQEEIMPAVPDNGPYPWEKTEQELKRRRSEMISRARFQSWLTELDDDQLAALNGNWENVMGDAALDRIDSWVIAGRAIAKLRSTQASSDQETGS